MGSSSKGSNSRITATQEYMHRESMSHWGPQGEGTKEVTLKKSGSFQDTQEERATASRSPQGGETVATGELQVIQCDMQRGGVEERR